MKPLSRPKKAPRIYRHINEVLKKAREVCRRPWQVYEEDERGEGMVYYYRTREQARAHMQRVRGNQFLKGWLVRGRNIQTDEVFS